MSKNQIQYQSGYSLPDLFKNYGSEQQCIDADSSTQILKC